MSDMTNSGGGVIPVYNMPNNDGMGGSIWVLLLVILLCGGGLFGGFGGVNSGVNTINNDFIYSNLSNSLNTGFTQVANNQFQTQRDIMQTGATLQMQIAQNGFNAQQCCCETNRNIDNVRFENAQNTCAITTNATNNTQKILDKLCDMERGALQTENANLRTALAQANGQLSQLSQTASIVSQIAPRPIPAVIAQNPNYCYYGNNSGYFN